MDDGAEKERDALKPIPLAEALTLGDRADIGQRISQSCRLCGHVCWHTARRLVRSIEDTEATLSEIGRDAHCPACQVYGGQHFQPAPWTPRDTLSAGHTLLTQCRRCGARARLHPARLVIETVTTHTHAWQCCTPHEHGCRGSLDECDIEVVDTCRAHLLTEGDDRRKAGQGDEVTLIEIASPHEIVEIVLGVASAEPDCTRIGPHHPLYARIIGRTTDEEIDWPHRAAHARWLIARIGRPANAPR